MIVNEFYLLLYSTALRTSVRFHPCVWIYWCFFYTPCSSTGYNLSVLHHPIFALHHLFTFGNRHNVQSTWHPLFYKCCFYVNDKLAVNVGYFRHAFSDSNFRWTCVFVNILAPYCWYTRDFWLSFCLQHVVLSVLTKVL